MTKTKEERTPAVRVKEHTLLASDLKCEVISDKKIPLTVDRCIAFLEMPVFEGERQVSQKHVQYLYDQWSTGRFMWEQAVITTCHLGDKQYRLNGQHTCWMRWNVGDQIKEEPSVKELVYRVKDMESLRALYCTIDRNKSRSNGHSFKALLVGSETAAGLWVSGLGNLSRGLVFWRFGDTKESRQMTPEDIAALTINTYSDLFKATGMLWQELFDTFRQINRAAIVAAMFETMNAKPDKAKDFWGPVCTGLGMNEETDPRHRLRLFLQTHGRGSNRNDLVSTSDEDMYRVCINAWNKWRKNKPVTVLKTTEEREKAV